MSSGFQDQALIPIADLLLAIWCLSAHGKKGTHLTPCGILMGDFDEQLHFGCQALGQGARAVNSLLGSAHRLCGRRRDALSEGAR